MLLLSFSLLMSLNTRPLLKGLAYLTHVGSGENGQAVVNLEAVRDEGHVRIRRDDDRVTPLHDAE